MDMVEKGPERTQQIISFHVGKEIYGVSMELVQEVISWPPVTKVHKSPPYVIGVINLRGQIVTVVDILKRLGVKAGEDSFGQIIIMNVKQEQLGMAVRRVGEVVEYRTEELSPAPSSLDPEVRPLFLGVLRREDKSISILDIGAMFNG
jgi:purine-binding chemotaxis protein CheW